MSPSPRIGERRRHRPALPEESAAASDATDDNKRVQAAPGAAMPPRFVADEDAEGRDTSLAICVALPFESATPSPEATVRCADARRTKGPLSNLPALARVASSAPGRGKCSTTPPRRLRRRLAGGLNGQKVQ